MADFKNVVSKLQHHYKDAKSIAIIANNGKMLYSTKNWNIKSDIKNLLASWTSNSAQSVTVASIRYSIVQMAPERFIATNRHNKGHLSPKAKGWFHLAYPAVARAAAMISKGSKSTFIETDVDTEEAENLAKSYNGLSKVGEINIDPLIKAEVEAFLEWIKNPQGLSSYLSYYLQQNNPDVISKLARLYDELYRIFYT